MQTVRWAIVEWLDDVHLNGLWGVRVDLLKVAIELSNFICRMSYAPISHSSTRKFVAGKYILVSHGLEVDATPLASKDGREITPVS